MMEVASLREETLLPRRIEFSAVAKQEVRSASVALEWRGVAKPGPGLRNVGNTCFLNSALQCLLHTPPVIYAEHSCRSQFCALCSLKRLSQAHSNSLVPQDFIQCLRLIGKQFRLGRQEDSHEFLRCVVERLPKDFVQATFRGKLRSLVRCQICHYESETLEDFLDLSLEISGPDLQRCLATFCREEVLDANNKYFCARCQKKVVATKQFSIRSCPAVLTVHLKRFTNQMRKDARPVAYAQELDLAPFCGQPAKYRLYAVLVHQGGTVHSGHYYAFVQAGNHLWYEMNDSIVTPTSAQRALSNAAAYILFYKQATTEPRPLPIPAPLPPPPQQVFRPFQTDAPALESLACVPLKRIGPCLWRAESRMNVLKRMCSARDTPLTVAKPDSVLALGYVKDEYDRQLDRGRTKKLKNGKRRIHRSLWDRASVHIS
jgi:ubiquitin carboxyl-terminal hydrolase 36/42